MTFTLKSLPNQAGEYIELPDMAELLTMPIFYDVELKEAYKYATEFQRKLMDSTPIVGDKRYLTVLSEVRFLTGSYRSMTGFNGTFFDKSYSEWHIDTIEDEKGVMEGFLYETDRIHLLTSKNTCMTQFLKNEIILDHVDPNVDRVSDVIEYVMENSNELDLETVDMPHNRIVTFSNHMHRAVNSKVPEFRYTFRIVETDRKRPPSNHTYNRDFITTIVDINGKKISNIEQTNDSIIIHLPKTIKDSPVYRPTKPTLDIKADLVVKISDLNIMRDQDDVKLIIIADNSLSDKDLNIFKNNANEYVKLYEDNNPDNNFELHLINIRVKDNKIIAEASFGKENSIYLNNCKYNISFDYESRIRFSNTDQVKVNCNL